MVQQRHTLSGPRTLKCINFLHVVTVWLLQVSHRNFIQGSKKTGEVVGKGTIPSVKKGKSSQDSVSGYLLTKLIVQNQAHSSERRAGDTNI